MKTDAVGKIGSRENGWKTVFREREGNGLILVGKRNAQNKAVRNFLNGVHKGGIKPIQKKSVGGQKKSMHGT